MLTSTKVTALTILIPYLLNAIPVLGQEVSPPLLADKPTIPSSFDETLPQRTYSESAQIIQDIIQKYKRQYGTYTDELHSDSNVPFDSPQYHSFRMQLEALSTPPYQQKQTVRPREGGRVFEAWYQGSNHTMGSSLIQEIELSKLSPCNGAATKWANIVSKIDSKFLPSVDGIIARLTLVLSDKKRNEFRHAAQQYDKTCLGRIADLPDAMVHSQRNAAIAVLLRNGTPFCGAFRLNSDTFVTARHCFFRKGAHPGRSTTGGEEDIKLSIIAKPTQQVAIRSKIGPSASAAIYSNFYSDANDYIFLKTDAISIEAPLTTLIPATVSDSLLLLGYYRFHQPEWVFGDPNSRGSENTGHTACDGLRHRCVELDQLRIHA